MNSDFEDDKREVALANRVLANLGLCVGLTAALGHASLRLASDPTRFLVKGASMSSMRWRLWRRTTWSFAISTASSSADAPV